MENPSLELFFDSSRLLVRSWLFAYNYFPCPVIFYCMLDSVWRFEQRAICTGSLKSKLILQPLGGVQWGQHLGKRFSNLLQNVHIPEYPSVSI
jgi:hypothetical protein